jgi:signal transduction histidine kinase
VDEAVGAAAIAPVDVPMWEHELPVDPRRRGRPHRCQGEGQRVDGVWGATADPSTEPSNVAIGGCESKMGAPLGERHDASERPSDGGRPVIGVPGVVLRAVHRHLPARTLRLRLALLYGCLFLLSGAALLVVTNVLVNTVDAPGVTIYLHGAPPSVGSTPAQKNRATETPNPDAAQRSADLRSLLEWSLVALGGMTLLSVGLGWYVAGRSLRPLRTMTSIATHISEANLHERLALPGPDDELKRLGDTIDGLLERLESAFAAQRRFVANVSHELRTPLATLRVAIDVAMAKPAPPPPETVALAEKMRRGLEQIDHLLESLLGLSRLQMGAPSSRVTRRLDDIVSLSVHTHAHAIADRQLHVEFTPGGEGWIEGDETLLSRMVDNVIDNAVRHNDRQGSIRVATERHDGRVRLVVDSGGPVLDDREVQALGQPFRRLGPDRTGSDKGFGLGLSIVAAIAEAHGGTLELHARDEGGLEVAITLPIANLSNATGVDP